MVAGIILVSKQIKINSLTKLTFYWGNRKNIIELIYFFKLSGRTSSVLSKLYWVQEALEFLGTVFF